VIASLIQPGRERLKGGLPENREVAPCIVVLTLGYLEILYRCTLTVET
jgi:hypothetical protein